MAYEVLLTADAEIDLQDLYEYIAHSDSIQAADHVLERLDEVASNLASDPSRGSTPKELRSLGIGEYRQVFFQALSRDLPRTRRTGRDLSDCGRSPEHAIATLPPPTAELIHLSSNPLRRG